MYYRNRRRYYGNYRRRYKEKKHTPSDLELLGYDREELISTITSKTSKLSCSSCSHITDLSELDEHAIYSGQYGIYIGCSGCNKNLSVPTKFDIDEEPELNNIIRSIEELRKKLKNINSKDIQKIF